MGDYPGLHRLGLLEEGEGQQQQQQQCMMHVSQSMGECEAVSPPVLNAGAREGERETALSSREEGGRAEGVAPHGPDRPAQPHRRDREGGRGRCARVYG